MQKILSNTILLVFVFTMSMRLESSELSNSEYICKSFYNSLFEKTSYREMNVYCSTAKAHKDWIMFEGYNYGGSQTRVISTRISHDYWLIFMNDPNSTLDIWLFSEKTLEQVTYGFRIDKIKVPIYSNDEISSSFLQAISNSNNIKLGYRFNKYNVSSKGSSAAIRYLIQTTPGKERWRTGESYSPE